MKFKCDKCKTTYSINDDRIPSKGGNVKCRVCKHIFKIYPPELKEIINNNEEKPVDPVIIFTPDQNKIKQLEKLFQQSQVPVTFFNNFKEAQQYFKIDTSQDFPKDIPQKLPQEFHQEYERSTPQNDPQEFQRGMPQDIPQEFQRAMPQDIPQEFQRSMPQDIPQEFQRGMPQDIPQEFQRGAPQNIPQEFQRAAPQNIPQEFQRGMPQNNSFSNENLYPENQDYYSEDTFSGSISSEFGEFVLNKKKSAKVISEMIYREYDTPLGGSEDGPLIEDTVAKHVSKMNGPLGLDIGTSHIVMAGNSKNRLIYKTNLNAFFAVPASEVTKRTLKTNKVPFFVRNDKIYVCGYAAQNFANIFNTSLRRPIESGLISPKEEDGFTVIRAILEKIVPKAEKENQELAFTVPGAPQNVVGAVTYHTSVIMKYLKEFGYKPIAVNEGFATVISELADDAYTGIGISMGGGMCNVCLSYMAVPIITYSLQKGGDYIDIMVSKSVGESTSKVKMIKEEYLDLSQRSSGRISTAFSIFYDELIAMVIESFTQVLDASSKIPRISKALPIVVSGGTAMPKGFEKRFANALSNRPLPLRISEVRIAEEPLYTTAKGAITMAISGGDIYPGGNNG